MSMPGYFHLIWEEKAGGLRSVVQKADDDCTRSVLQRFGARLKKKEAPPVGISRTKPPAACWGNWVTPVLTTQGRSSNGNVHISRVFPKVAPCIAPRMAKAHKLRHVGWQRRHPLLV